MVYLGDCLSVHQDRLNLAGLFPGLKRRLFWSEPKACPGRKITYVGGQQIDCLPERKLKKRGKK